MASVLLSGASGFIGSQLRQSLVTDGHRVIILTRRGGSNADSVFWNAEDGRIDIEALDRASPEIVFNLAGEPIAKRWTDRRRRAIRSSRVNGTTALARALAKLKRPPRALISGSAIGFYGADRGDEILDEESAPGHDFLSHTAMEWEQATRPAHDAGIRVALARTGIVLGTRGGALQRMILPFRFGVGGRIGSGRQWMSWISLEDMVRALRYLGSASAAAGAFNLVAPAPVGNAAFARTLGRVMHRPALFPVPAFALRLIFGEMADHTILASQRVIPKRLAGAGFEFRHPRLEDALRFELTRSADRVDR